MVFQRLKRYLLILLCALVSCVGQKEDPEDDITPGGTSAVAGAGIVLDFTATWCVNCPRMTTAIEEAAAERAIIPICVHYQDVFECSHGTELIGRFGVEAYPSAVMNMSKGTLITATSKDLILAKLDAAKSAKAPCSIEASLDADGTVKVKVTAAEEGIYTLSAALLEDGLVSAQTGAGDNYVHNNVFRGFLQENPLGDSLGQLAKGASAERSFSAGTITQMHHVAVFVCHDGTVNTATDLKI